jgi:hypothetical protein
VSIGVCEYEYWYQGEAWDPGQPFRLSIQQWPLNYRMVHGKIHVMRHANAAAGESDRRSPFRGPA